MTLEVELPQLRGVDISYLPKIKQLLLIISESAPFIPNISKLCEWISITRNVLLTYLNVLAESKLTYNCFYFWYLSPAKAGQYLLEK